MMSLLKNGEVKPVRFKNMSSVTVKSSNNISETQNWVEVVRQHVGSLRFGVVQIVVHDSQVTQIDKTERVRLDKARAQTI
jgi:hypothetical protein